MKKKTQGVPVMQAKVRDKTSLHRGRVFELTLERVMLPNGQTTNLEIIRHPGASGIVALPGDGSVLLVRQYRHAVGDYLWEIPAGTLEPGETPLECANRELLEEGGYRAGSWKELGVIHPVPAYSDERIHLFLAEDLSPGDQDLDPDEVLEVHRVPWKEISGMIRKGAIRDSKTISSLALARLAMD